MNYRFRAYGKVNLTLEILNRREDGYHNITSLLQMVSLYDEVVVEFREGEDIELEVSGPFYFPDVDYSSVVRAANAFFNHHFMRTGVRIKLIKNLPVGGGFGGESADAAAVWAALADYFGFPLEEGAEDLRNVGTETPVFLRGGTLRTYGVGDRCEEIHVVFPYVLLVIFPGFGISTKEAYSKWMYYDTFSDGTFTENAIKKLEMGIELEDEDLYNSFVNWVAAEYDFYKPVKKKLLDSGAVGVSLSGSGSSMFALFKDKECAEEMREFFDHMYFTRIVEPVSVGVELVEKS